MKQNQPTRAPLSEVDAARLMQSVRAIAQTVRTPGTPGEEAAFRYLESELNALGLAVRLFRRSAYISLPKASEFSVNGQTISSITHALLPSAALKNKELRYIPSCDFYTAEPVRFAQKIIVTEGLPTYPLIKYAQDREASALVFISGRLPHEMIVSRIWASPTPETKNQLLNTPAISVSRADGDILKELLSKASGCRADLSTTVVSRWLDIPILTADLQSPVSDDYLLLSGHVDSWHYGAMDNASGNAAALEIARVLSRRANELRRGIKFAFWSGHSHGRYAGSAAFCDACFQDLSQHCFLHVNIDCLGGRGATVLTQAACMAETKALGATAVKEVTGQTLEGVRFSRSSDQSFWGTGTPSLFAGVSEQPPSREKDAAERAFSLLFGGAKSGGFGWWWHTPADTVERLDPAFLQRDCRIYLHAVYRACTKPRIPLNIPAAAEELYKYLQAYASSVRCAPEFAPLLTIVRQIQTQAERLEALSRTDEAFVYTYNQWILAMERILVPLSYVKGSIFSHDPALRQPPVPSLPAADGADLDDAFHLALLRRRNHIENELLRALRCTNDTFNRFRA